MAHPIYAWIEGTKQGAISGFGSWGSQDSRVGLEDSTFIVGVEAKVTSPKDVRTGMATGARQHHPIKLTKRVDKATPLLYAALVNNESLKLKVKFYRSDPTGTGSEINYYTIELENAHVAEITDAYRYPMSAADLNDDHYPLEVVQFTYQKIVWTWNDGGVTGTDDWTAPSIG
jgi:type VI secretion system secreted protein Hcp